MYYNRFCVEDPRTLRAALIGDDALFLYPIKKPAGWRACVFYFRLEFITERQRIHITASVGVFHRQITVLVTCRTG